ncbi:MAG: sulfite exporter TauE/SafE family protein [Rhodospirillales bacterium]|nr:sulfite exporter TauE/SafE family protein [Rhodospirillales bacterium]
METVLSLVTLENAAIVAIIVAGGFVRGYTGFGSGLVMAPLLTLFWGPVEAVATTVGVGAVASVQVVPGCARQCDWRTMAPMSLAAVLFVPVGTFMLVSLDPEIVKNIIAAIVLFVTAISLRGWTYRGPAGPIPAFLAGGVTALVNGIAAVGGPASVMYLMSLPNRAERHRANITIITTVIGWLVLFCMVVAGAVSQGTVIKIALLILPNAFGVWAGSRMFALLPGRVFRLIVLWMLVAVSVAILVS